MPSRRARILLIDDDESIAKFVNHTLSRREFDVIWTRTVQEPLELTSQTPPDMVLLDIFFFFPNESGWD